MSFARVFVVLFVNLMYCWPQRGGCDATLTETNEERYSVMGASATDKWQRRIKRTVVGNAPAIYETSSSDYVKSTTENESPPTVRAFDAVVTRETVTATGTSIAGYRDDPEVSEETNTQESNNIHTTSAANSEMRRKLSDYMATKVGNAINRYAQPVIFTVGVVGNMISMLVMFQRHNRHTSFGIYFGVLALSDTLVLGTSTAFWLVVAATGCQLQNTRILGQLATNERILSHPQFNIRPADGRAIPAECRRLVQRETR